MRSLTDMVVAALGVEDTEAGEEVDTTSSAVMIGAGMVGACVGWEVLPVVVFSVVISLFVVVVSRWERKIRTMIKTSTTCADFLELVDRCWIQAGLCTTKYQEAK